MRVDEGYVRDVIHAFNERVFDALDPNGAGVGPRPSMTRPVRRSSRRRRPTPAPSGCRSPAGARSSSPPTWPARKIATIGREAVRRILRAEKVTFQTTITWKGVQRFRIRQEDAPRAGPLRPPTRRRPSGPHRRVRPTVSPTPQGKAWQPARRPKRLRATYTRAAGVRHMLAALDLATGHMTYRIRTRKRWRRFLHRSPSCATATPISGSTSSWTTSPPHKHAEVTTWCDANNVELLFVPTHASWLNWIEAEFAALRYSALNGTDDHDHTEQSQAIGDYIRWRNSNAELKRLRHQFQDPKSRLASKLPGHGFMLSH
jgi:hypothetical protein